MISNTVVRQIEWGDCDPAGIVFNPRYFAFFDHCTALLYSSAGLPKKAMLETFGIIGCPLVAINARFIAPCTVGDEVSIISGFLDIRSSSFDIRHDLTREGVVCVEAVETRVWTKRDQESGRLKSAPIPAEVAARFRGIGTSQRP